MAAFPISGSWLVPSPLLLALQTPDKQRLFKGAMQLEDSKKLAEMQIGNDDILAMTFCQAGELIASPYLV